MSNQDGKKMKDFGLWVYDPNNERAVKLDFSGNITLDNGNKGTILGIKGQSRDGNKRFLKIFAQVGTLWKNDDGRFTGDMNYPDAGGQKALIGWLNDNGDVLSGYKNDPKPKQNSQKPKQEAAPF